MHFLSRPKMWIRDIDQDQVVAFVHGVELGDETIKLTYELAQLLEKQYKIKLTATGWPYQVQRFATRKSLSWFDGFRFLMEEILQKQ